MKPPYIMFYTPSGRFELNEKICLSFTNYHPEFWQPAWTIQSILLALVSFMPVREEMLAIGAINSSPKERQMLAKKSLDWKCPVCNKTNREIAEEHMLAEDDAQAEEELKNAGVGMP
jgi:ubiquitin-conjugating enzyme E2 J1